MKGGQQSNWWSQFCLWLPAALTRRCPPPISCFRNLVSDFFVTKVFTWDEYFWGIASDGKVLVILGFAIPKPKKRRVGALNKANRWNYWTTEIQQKLMKWQVTYITQLRRSDMELNRNMKKIYDDLSKRLKCRYCLQLVGEMTTAGICFNHRVKF